MWSLLESTKVFSCCVRFLKLHRKVGRTKYPRKVEDSTTPGDLSTWVTQHGCALWRACPVPSPCEVAGTQGALSAPLFSEELLLCWGWGLWCLSLLFPLSTNSQILDVGLNYAVFSCWDGLSTSPWNRFTTTIKATSEYNWIKVNWMWY